MRQSIQEPAKDGKRKRNKKVYPAMNSSSRDTPGGRKRKRKRRKQRERGEDKRRSQLCTSHPGTRQEGGLGVAAEVPELVVVTIYALMDKALTCVVFCRMAAFALWLLRRATTSI